MNLCVRSSAVAASACLLLLGAIGSSAQIAAEAPKAASCPHLAQLGLASAKVISADVVAAGAFTPPAAPAAFPPGADPIYKNLPEFCRVQITATPSADSDIKIELWLPLAHWNGRFQAIGNGGFAGEMPYHSLAEGVLQSYATASTDTGHSGSAIDAQWALHHPEEITDFGYRAVHVMTELAKSTTSSFFGSAPKHSYFAACSNGGRQALMEAQRYPEDYDGIIAGAPANDWTHLLTSAVWDAQVTTNDPASYIPLSKAPAIAQAVNTACDAKDGVADGTLNDPRRCKFDPAVMLCQKGDSDQCLTPAQVSALKRLYQGARDSYDQQIFPGFLPGGELGRTGWSLWILGPGPGKALLFAFGNGFFANMVYSKADWDYKTADIDAALHAADALAQTFNATDPDLTRFAAHGGKLLMYHGWNDAAISALNSVAYFNSVGRTMGEAKRDGFARLYLAPGMQHCAGGPGPDSFGQSGPGELRDAQHSAQVALEGWVEKGAAPGAIIAGKYGDNAKANTPPEMTRPLCPYPQVANYKGSGSTKDAGNFACVAER